MKQLFYILIIALAIAACSDSDIEPDKTENPEFFMKVNINGQQSRWMNTENERRLIARRASYDGTASSDYQIGFKEPKEEYSGTFFRQTYSGRQKLIIRFPDAIQQQDNGFSSYLEQARSYTIGAIEPGSTPKIKTYFYYSDFGWYNISNSRLTDLRWQFEDQLLAGAALDEQTESNDYTYAYTYAYTYDESLNNQVGYEMYDNGRQLHRNQLHVDFSDASKKFIVNLRPSEDTLYAITQGSGPFQYEWNTGSDEPFILTGGDTTTRYSVTVTDSYGQQASANATYFFDSTQTEDGATPVFSGIGAFIENLNWEIVSDDEPGRDVELIYINEEGTIFYSKLTSSNDNGYFEIQETSPFTYRGGCIDLPCPEYYLGGTAIQFQFSSVLASPNGEEIEISAGEGLMPVYLSREL